ncbi:deoxynucleoside kinase isoform X1 [Lasioglossum baleicum]|uniref:deoxynucleoside kinase isoform X1 n=2 Tax=Lasioglossum baleicum TaxID=434251 RepID=UPI003FCDCB8B
MTFIGKAVVTVLSKMTNVPFKLYKRPFTVCIEGNIGSGKTTFLSHFKQFNDTTVLEEPVELWRDIAGTNLLEMMYTDTSRYAFLFQSYVQLTMLQLHTHKTPHPYKIMERSVYSGRCFVEHMKRKKILNVTEAAVLDDWYEWSMNSANIETNLIVYLRTSPDIVYQRLKARARKEEKHVSLEYLEDIHNIHEEWLYHKTLFTLPAPVLILDGDKTLEEMVNEFQHCKNRIFGTRIEGKSCTGNIDVPVSPTCSEPEVKT